MRRVNSLRRGTTATTEVRAGKGRVPARPSGGAPRAAVVSVDRRRVAIMVCRARQARRADDPSTIIASATTAEGAQSFRARRRCCAGSAFRRVRDCGENAGLPDRDLSFGAGESGAEAAVDAALVTWSGVLDVANVALRAVRREPGHPLRTVAPGRSRETSPCAPSCLRPVAQVIARSRPPTSPPPLRRARRDHLRRRHAIQNTNFVVFGVTAIGLAVALMLHARKVFAGAVWITVGHDLVIAAAAPASSLSRRPLGRGSLFA